MVAADTRISAGKPSRPDGSRQAGMSASEINSLGCAFRGIFFGVILGAFLWAAMLWAFL